MITHYPYFNSSYYRYFPHYSYSGNSTVEKHNKNTVNLNNDKYIKKENIKVKNKKKYTKENRQSFDVFGIKLYFDDILLIALILFLYNEDIQDQYLFISLILLLLS